MAIINHTSTGASNTPRPLSITPRLIWIDQTDMFLDIQAEYVSGSNIMNNIPFGVDGKQIFGTVGTDIVVEAPSGGSTAPIFSFVAARGGIIKRSDKIGMATGMFSSYVNTYIMVQANGGVQTPPFSTSYTQYPFLAEGVIGTTVIRANSITMVKPLNTYDVSTKELSVLDNWGGPMGPHTYRASAITGSLGMIYAVKQTQIYNDDSALRQYFVDLYSITPSSVTLVARVDCGNDRPGTYPGTAITMSRVVGWGKMAAYLGWKRDIGTEEMKVIAEYMARKYALEF